MEMPQPRAIVSGSSSRVAHVAADEGLDARQMRLAHGGVAGGQRALVGLERQHQKVDQLLAHGGARLRAHRVEAVGDQVQHVGEQAARAIGGVELQRAEAVRLADAAAQRLGLDLQHPEIGGLGVAELIGLVAALQDEAARDCSARPCRIARRRLRSGPER